ncbi:MAG: methyltransferase domain-containing protein [Alphaproteobacteria bacterium]
MVDLFQTLPKAPPHVIDRVGDRLENRARDPAQIAILESYIADLVFPAGAIVVELGCGTGPVCRRFAAIADVARVIGIEPAPGLVDKARTLADSDKLDFQVGTGEASGLDDGVADIVVLHTLLSHVPDQDAILDETLRLLKPGGQLAVCDADFSKTSVAIGDADPLQTCVEAWAEISVTDRWLGPRLPGLLKAKGFAVRSFKGHSRVDIAGISTGPGWVTMGADALARSGRISEATAEALKVECQRRIDEGRFYAALPFVTAVATRG